MTPTQTVALSFWESFKKHTDQHPRGPFLRLSDDGARVKCVLLALAEVVGPMVFEIKLLRDRVAELESR